MYDTEELMLVNDPGLKAAKSHSGGDGANPAEAPKSDFDEDALWSDVKKNP